MKDYKKDARQLRTRLKNANMKIHVMQFCMDYDIEFSVNNNCYEEALADFEDRRIEVPEILGDVTYFISLHELGHLLHPLGCPLKSSVLEAESYAWEWALKNSIISPNKKVKTMISRCLQRYCDYVGSDRRYKIPNKKDLFWKILDGRYY